jgi:N-acetyl-beta-hexosaminidase
VWGLRYPSEVATYSQEVVREVVRYAQMRGVRVVVELDTPGHAYVLLPRSLPGN